MKAKSFLSILICIFMIACNNNENLNTNSTVSPRRISGIPTLLIEESLCVTPDSAVMNILFNDFQVSETYNDWLEAYLEEAEIIDIMTYDIISSLQDNLYEIVGSNSSIYSVDTIILPEVFMKIVNFPNYGGSVIFPGLCEAKKEYKMSKIGKIDESDVHNFYISPDIYLVPDINATADVFLSQLNEASNFYSGSTRLGFTYGDLKNMTADILEICKDITGEMYDLSTAIDLYTLNLSCQESEQYTLPHNMRKRITNNTHDYQDFDDLDINYNWYQTAPFNTLQCEESVGSCLLTLAKIAYANGMSLNNIGMNFATDHAGIADCISELSTYLHVVNPNYYEETMQQYTDFKYVVEDVLGCEIVVGDVNLHNLISNYIETLQNNCCVLIVLDKFTGKYAIVNRIIQRYYNFTHAYKYMFTVLDAKTYKEQSGLYSWSSVMDDESLCFTIIHLY